MKSLVLFLITLALATSLETDQNTEVALNEYEKIEIPIFDFEVSDTADKLEIAERGISEGIYAIVNVETNRLLFQDGPKIKGSRGAEKGWKASSGFEAPAVVGADANYYNRALWKIIPQGGDKYLIENLETKRYLFQDGPVMKGPRGAEKGWAASSGFKAPAVVGADANYYNRAYWKIIPLGGGKYFIENPETKRYLFQGGPAIKGPRGAEHGWAASSGFKAPDVVGADANYYNRAYWMITPVSNGRYFIENIFTKRLLFQTGPPIKGNRGAEGGWKNANGLTSPVVVGADANYYNRAYWMLHKVR